MVPSSRPQFGLGCVMGAILRRANRISVEQIEAAYAQAYRMPYAILLPSGRAGICWALQACIGQDTRVVCPAYTCMVVWESILRAGGKLDVIDTADNSFLMDGTTLNAAQMGNYAIVLCEVYGYTYDLSKITCRASSDPLIRIVDMAMTVPTGTLFERLANGDFAVTSFGSGKCMYAGWGGMGFTRDKVLADKITQIRESSISHCDLLLFVKRSMKMIAKNLLNEPIAYGFLKKMKEARSSIRQHFAPRVGDSAIYSMADQPVSKEWYLPTTFVDRHLMLYNLEHTEQYCEHRKTLTRRYHENFDGVSGIIRPSISPHALSHYTIRVDSSIRPLVKKRLETVGIDAGTLFFFPKSFSKSDYPNASRIAAEVLNLPLDIRLSVSDVDWISERVVRVVERFSESPT